MVQHSVKRKIQLPQGLNKKKSNGGRVVKKNNTVAPKKGHHLQIAPKNLKKIQQFKADREITKAINADNEELIRASSSK